MLDVPTTVVDWEGPAASAWRWCWGVTLALILVAAGLFAAAWGWGGGAPWTAPAAIGTLALAALWIPVGFLPVLRRARTCGVRLDFPRRTLELRDVVVRRGLRLRRHDRLVLPFSAVRWTDDLSALCRGRAPRRPAAIFLGTAPGEVSLVSSDRRFCTVVVEALKQVPDRSFPPPACGPTPVAAAAMLLALAGIAAVAFASILAGEVRTPATPPAARPTSAAPASSPPPPRP